MAGDSRTLALADVVEKSAYHSRVGELAEQIAATSTLPALHEVLHRIAGALGAERALFATFVQGSDQTSSYRLLFDTDPGWAQRYVTERCFSDDPWLAYAAKHSEPLVASALTTMSGAQRRVAAMAIDAGFISVALVPAHSPHVLARVSVLCLGHSQPGFFDTPAFNQLKVAARGPAMELHDWWAAHERRELLRSTPLSQADIALLERHCRGQSAKRIAAELHVSKSLVDSRFRRLMIRLGVPNRRAAAQRAIDCGLIVR